MVIFNHNKSFYIKTVLKAPFFFAFCLLMITLNKGLWLFLSCLIINVWSARCLLK